VLDYLRAIWRCRYFWLSLVRMDLRTRYRGSMFGLGWSLLHPIALTAILCTVFHQVFHVAIREYAPLVLSGLACWNYILHSTLFGCQSFFQAESYIRQYPAPLAIYPLRTALGATLHFILALFVALCLAWFFRGFGSPLALLSLAPGIALLFVFAWSAAVLTAFANVYFQDTQHICEIGFQILFYLTPIMYKPEVLETNHLGWLLRLNPLVPFLDLVRQPIVAGQVASPASFVLAGVMAVVTTTAAGFTLATLQRRLVFHL
jgi:ABC-type polysaccharide/polyol phosphate export permease